MVRSGPWREIIGHLASVGWFDGSRSALGRGLGRTCRGWHTVSILTLSSSMTTISRRVRPTSPAGALRLRLWLAPLLWESEQKTADYFRSVVAVTSFGSSEKKKSWLSLALGGCPATSNAAMETRSKRRKTEPVVDKVRRGEISVVVALAEELPDLFAAEILPKLDFGATLNLAQVSKSFNRAVWSVGGVRSMEAKIVAELKIHPPSVRSDSDTEEDDEAHIWPTYRLCTAPMFWAAEYGNLPAVRALLESGWDVNRPFVTIGFPALHHAAGRGHTAVVKVLIEAGADVNFASQNEAGETPLSIAAEYGHEAVVNALIEAGADVNLAVGNNEPFPGSGPLIPAAFYGQSVCVALLLDAGADVNKATNDGWTPLHWAVINGHGVTVGKLIDAGADLNRTTTNGHPEYTPMSLALALGHGNVVELLKQAGAIHEAE